MLSYSSELGNVLIFVMLRLFVVFFDKSHCKTISALPIVPSCFSVMTIYEPSYLYDVIKFYVIMM